MVETSALIICLGAKVDYGYSELALLMLLEMSLLESLVSENVGKGDSHDSLSSFERS